MADRPLRFCDVCKQVDDHPRHVQTGKTLHMDCCAAEGCGTCAGTEVLYGGRRGQELIDHLEETRG